MKKSLLYFIVFCFVISDSFSQNNQTKFQIVYNGATSNNGFFFSTATKNSLNGYMSMGWIFGGSTLFPAATVFETDTMGNVLWARKYKGDNLFGTTPLTINDFVKSGTNYLITGQRGSDAMLMKINSNGGTINFSNTYSGNDGWGNKIKEDVSGNIIVAGSSEYKSINPDKDSTSIYIFKTNSSGTFQWGRSYTLTSPVFDSQDEALDVVAVPTGYVFTGYQSEKNGSDTTRNILLFMTDLNGTLQWMKSYGAIGNNEQGNSIVYDAANNQFVIMGYTDAASAFGDICLLRTDASGNLLSSTAYGTNFGLAQSTTLIATSDGGYAIVGWAAVFSAITFKPFLVKLNSSFGMQFTKYYNPSVTGGFFVGGDEAVTHGYIISSMTADANYGGWATELIKTDSQGKTDNVSSSCSETNYTPAQRTYAPTTKTITPTMRTGGSGSSFSGGNSAFTPANTIVCVVCSKPSASILSTPASTICSGSSATLTATGGGTYAWNTGSTSAFITVSPTTTTVYSCSVTVSSCDSVVPFTVTVSSGPSVSISGNTTICNGQTASLTASGGGTYVWNTAATTASISVSPTTNTSYSVVVTDATGCTNSSSTNVVVNSAPVAMISGAAPICVGDSVTLSASGGTGYSWNTGATTTAITDSPTTNTTYTVTVSNGSCSSTTTATITVNSLPSPTISGNTNLCTGRSTTLTASGGINYSWNTTATTNSISVAPTTNTSYTVAVTNANGCSDTATVNVIVAPPPTASISGNSTICVGESASLAASGGLTYSWTTGATTSAINISPTTNTTYSVIVSVGTCSDTASINVTVNPSPVATISGTNNICNGQSTTLTASGGGTYSWSPTGQTTDSIFVSPTANTSYSVIVTNSNGCTATAVSSVTVVPVPNASISPSTTICSGDVITITASGGTTYVWNPTGQTTNSIIVNPSSNTTYSVIVANGNCSSSASTNISVNPKPTASAGTDITISYGDDATLTAGGGGNYSWNTGATTINIVVTPTATTDYCVIVTNAEGCTDSACVQVIIDFNCGDVFLPNAFSPNNDGHNDFFVPRNICFKTLHLVVYDRWGNKVFETTDINTKGWDGTYKGERQNTAVFTYIFTYELITGTSDKLKGSVTLLR